MRKNRYHQRPFNNGKIVGPAIALITISCLGLLGTGYSAVLALAGEVQIDQNDPPWLQEMERKTVGPFAFVVQATFFVVNLVIIAAAYLQIKRRAYVFAIVASVLAICNIGSCCCILDLPAGIVNLIFLLQPDVKQAFLTSVK